MTDLDLWSLSDEIPSGHAPRERLLQGERHPLPSELFILTSRLFLDWIQFTNDGDHNKSGYNTYVSWNWKSLKYFENF